MQVSLGVGDAAGKAVLTNTVSYERDGASVRSFVAGSEFSRNMSQVVTAAKNIQTIIIPSTVRRVLDGAFSGTLIEQVTLPATLETARSKTFYACELQMRTIFRDDSRLEKIGTECFFGCGFAEIEVPRALRTMAADAF